MPTAYELMEAYRTWWRTSYSTSPNRPSRDPRRGLG
jgi:hypothetical protein